MSAIAAIATLVSFDIVDLLFGCETRDNVYLPTRTPRVRIHRTARNVQSLFICAGPATGMIPG
jgi:hypothetical protein